MFAGQVFVPATLLHWLAPWQSESKPPWNPLMYDSVGQFYPWRHFAGETLQAGRLPLWNPYQFCGTPFVANSQSAVFYPGNLLFYLLPTATAAGWSVLLHLSLAAGFMYGFLRAVGVRPAAGVVGSIAFAFSTWQVSWLSLPTFLCTSCWLPLILLFILRLFDQPTLRRAVALGFTVGMTLLAGHLQIAFYILLAALLFAGWLLLVVREEGRGERGRKDESRVESRESREKSTAHVMLSPTPNPKSKIQNPKWTPFFLFLLALVLGGMIAAPQVVPALELSRRSHRQSTVTAQGYESYTAYAVHAGALVTLFLPDYFGNPSDANNPYMGSSRGNKEGGMYFNYAEGALYVGIPTLLLAVFALLHRRPKDPKNRMLGYLGLLALLSLLVALGTLIDALFYFYVPGFGQSGSPGRALVLWAFAVAGLAALGCDALLDAEEGTQQILRKGMIANGILVGLAALFFLLGPKAFIDPEFAAKALYVGQMPRQAGLVVLSVGLLLWLASGRAKSYAWAGALPAVLLTVDLLATGSNFNLTAERQEVYPATPVLTTLQEKARHDRILPFNRRGWSFTGPTAVLPPNGAMVFGLHDVQGYDSLFPGQYKQFMNDLATPVATDASPPEVGNMVFAKNPTNPLVKQTGVRYVLSQEPLPLAGETIQDGLYLYELTDAPGRAQAVTADGRRVPIEWQEDSPTRVTLAVDAPALVVLTLADEAFPGWLATLDGRPVSVERAEPIFRRVSIPAGRHVLAFTYRPMGFRFGLYLLLAAISMGAATLCWRRLDSRA